MTGQRSRSDDEAAAAAEAALSRAWDRPVALADIQALSDSGRRNLILRGVALAGTGRRPVIVKATRSSAYAPHSSDAFRASGFVREWAARALLASRQGHAELGLLAGDASTGVMVFADLGADAGSLVAPLLEGAAADAEGALTGYAAALARLHAATVGCRHHHAQALAAAFPKASRPEVMGLDWVSGTPPEINGRSLPEDEIAAARARIADPGPWLALVHGDLCPDNILFAGGRGWPIDFEFSAPGHALIDAVYWRMGFPTCWCAGVLPPELADRIEAVYRRELAGTVPEAADDRLYACELAAAFLARLVFHLRWLLPGALEGDGHWGIARNRARVLWHLAASRDAFVRADVFPGTVRTIDHWLGPLARRWPESSPLPLYPAFAPASEAS